MTDTHFAILHTWGHADGVQKFSFERSFKNVLFTKRFRTVFCNVYIKEKNQNIRYKKYSDSINSAFLKLGALILVSPTPISDGPSPCLYKAKKC